MERPWIGRDESGWNPPTHYLDANDSLNFFLPLDDVIRLGRTDTNVGDVQVLLLDRGSDAPPQRHENGDAASERETDR